MSEELIEKVARAIENHFSGADRAYGEHIQCAKDALAAIDASGTHVVVPVEPTQKMIGEGGLTRLRNEGSNPVSFIYAAMLAARPKVTP